MVEDGTAEREEEEGVSKEYRKVGHLIARFVLTRTGRLRMEKMVVGEEGRKERAQLELTRPCFG